MKKSFVQKGGAFATALILILTHVEAQQLDPNFKPSVEWSYGKVFDFEKQPDGKIILAGDFQIFDNLAHQHLVRINPDGTPDPSFNTGAGPNQRILDIALQPDGKLLVLGPFTSFAGEPVKDLVRLNPNGSLDGTFYTNTGFDTSPYSLAIQSDGEILVTGPFTSYNGTNRNHLIRLHTSGQLDTGFDIGAGLSGGTSYIITIQPDNKIILGGGFSMVNGLTKAGICRFNTNGSIDNAFTATGTGLTSAIFDIDILASGKILVGGQFTSFNGATKSSLVRLNSNGTNDDTFIATAVGLVTQMVVMPDSSIYIIGSLATVNGVNTGPYARIMADGALISNFPLKQFPGLMSAVAVGDKLITYGTEYTNAVRYKLARLNANGTTDASFSQNAILKTAGGVVSAMQRTGKIIIGGQMIYLNGVEKRFLARLTRDGKPDSTFSVGTGPNSTISSIAIQPDDKILLGGLFSSFHDQVAWRIIRLNSDGTTDPSFVSPTSDFGTLYSLSLQADGKIIVSGLFVPFKGTAVANIFRLNTDGSLEPSFNVGQGPNSVVNLSLIQPDGKIVAFGYFSSWNGNPAGGVVRLNSDGSPDASFTPGSGFDNTITTAALTPDNKIYAGGNFQNFDGVGVPYMTRLNTNGTRDVTFDPIFPGTLNPVSSLVVRADGNVMVGKNKYPFAGDYPRYLFQLNPSGTPDPDFIFRGPNNGVEYILKGIDENFIVSGSFDSVNVASRIGLFAILSELPTGLKENKLSSAFVWRNTQTGEFTVQTNWNNGFDLMVSDVMGKPVYSASSQDDQFRFQLLAHSAGIYILRIASEDKILSMRILN